MSEPILRLDDVSQTFSSRKPNGLGRTVVTAADHVDLDIREGETLAIVGESGSGKSTLAKLLLMLSSPTAGKVAFRGTPLGALSKQDRAEYRRQVQAVFQDPSSSLNPRMSVEQSLGYIIRRHELATKAEQRAFILRHLASVGLTPAEQYLGRFPHQLSGGQQQRIAIARAMMLEPKVIIADEPLSSLDVSIQAQILELMRDLRARTNIGLVVISHDLGAMQSIADRTAVMYRGSIVEIGDDVYEHPAHPYTRMLLDARLTHDPRRSRIRAMESPRRPPQPGAGRGGCKFRDRCPYAIEICATAVPQLRPTGAGAAQAACHRASELIAAMTQKPIPSLDHAGQGGKAGSNREETQ